MITVSYNAYCAISKEGDNDIWTVRPRGVVPLLPLCSQIDVGATVNALLGDTFSRENNTHGSRFHDRDPQFASRILGAMTQSCYIGTRDIRSRVIRGPYCISKFDHENPWSRSSVWSKDKVTFDLQNSKVNVMVKFKPIGHIWGLGFNRYVCHDPIVLYWNLWYTEPCYKGSLLYLKIWPWKSMVKVICVVKGQGHIWPSKFKGQGYGQVQTHWSHLRPRVQSICLLFVSRQSDHFWLRYSKFYIWPWKFKVKVMAKVKPDGHIWALEFNWYVCISFRSNRTIFGWDIANSVFDLENSRSRSNPMVTFEP